MCGINSMLVLLNPPQVNPKRVKGYSKCLHEIKTDGIDLTDGSKVDDVGDNQKN